MAFLGPHKKPHWSALGSFGFPLGLPVGPKTTQEPLSSTGHVDLNSCVDPHGHVYANVYVDFLETSCGVFRVDVYVNFGADVDVNFDVESEGDVVGF